MKYPSAKLSKHMVGRTASVLSPFYSLLPVYKEVYNGENDSYLKPRGISWVGESKIMKLAILFSVFKFSC